MIMSLHHIIIIAIQFVDMLFVHIPFPRSLRHIYRGEIQVLCQTDTMTPRTILGIDHYVFPSGGYQSIMIIMVFQISTIWKL
jgi:hypothetical protein